MNKIPKTSGFSIWLLPDERTNGIIRNVIRHFSKSFSTPLFVPHITLSGTPNNTEQRDLIPIIDKLASKETSFSVHTNGVVCGKPPFQRFYLSVQSAGVLNSLSVGCNELLNDSFAGKNNFHFSLMYSFTECDKIQRTFREWSMTIPLELYIQSIALTDLSGLPDEWEIIYRRDLLT